jgi:hypothetical protein
MFDIRHLGVSIFQTFLKDIGDEFGAIVAVMGSL